MSLLEGHFAYLYALQVKINLGCIEKLSPIRLHQQNGMNQALARMLMLGDSLLVLLLSFLIGAHALASAYSRRD